MVLGLSRVYLGLPWGTPNWFSIYSYIGVLPCSQGKPGTSEYRNHIEPHVSIIVDTYGGISSVNYNIANKIISFGYNYVDGEKPIYEEQVKSCGTVKQFIYDDENGTGKIIFEDKVTSIGTGAFLIVII